MIGKTMTVARRPGAHLPLAPLPALAAALVLLLVLLVVETPPPVQAQTTELVVIDHRSGLAIGGFDPVAYFVEGVARPGEDGIEYRFAGAFWRFCNAGNRAAFIADPDVYMPRYGGYDPVAVARGVAAAGDPRLWLIVGERLHLFHQPQTRTAFAAGAEAAVAAAEKRWPSVKASLSP